VTHMSQDIGVTLRGAGGASLVAAFAAESDFSDERVAS
jgi:hypothetical protein